MEEAGPSTPVEVLGFDGVPAAGDRFLVTPNEQQAREIASIRQRMEREERAATLFNDRSEAEIAQFMGKGEKGKIKRVLDVVVRADVQGSAEAIMSSVAALESADDRVSCTARVLRASAGEISKEDVQLASVSSGGLVIGFNVQAGKGAVEEAERLGSGIAYFKVVYDVLDEIQGQLNELLRPAAKGSLCGVAEVLQVFNIGKVGNIAGSKVTEGRIKFGGWVEIVRGEDLELIYDGKIKTLRSVKEEVEEMEEGTECGIGFGDGFEDLEEGDMIRCYSLD